jgi:hypothetical protein
VGLYIHFPIRLHGVVFNWLRTGTTFPLPLKDVWSVRKVEVCPNETTEQSTKLSIAKKTKSRTTTLLGMRGKKRGLLQQVLRETAM